MRGKIGEALFQVTLSNAYCITIELHHAPQSLAGGEQLSSFNCKPSILQVVLRLQKSRVSEY